MGMFLSLTFAVEFQETWRAKEIQAVFTDHSCVRMLAFLTYQTRDVPLSVFQEIGAGLVDCCEARRTEEGSTLHTLTICNYAVTCNANKLLNFQRHVRAAVARGMELVKTFLTEMILTLLTLQYA